MVRWFKGILSLNFVVKAQTRRYPVSHGVGPTCLDAIRKGTTFDWEFEKKRGT